MSMDDTWVRASDLIPKPVAKKGLAPFLPSSKQGLKEQRATTTTVEDLAPPPVSQVSPKKATRKAKGKPILSVSGLTVSFPRSGTIFEGLNLKIHEGEKVCIVGSNGAGKSTLIKACLGIVPAQEGTVELLGQRYLAKDGPSKEQLAQIGMVHQRHNLISRATALANALHGALGRCDFKPALWYQSFAPSELREQALHYLDRVGVGHKAGNLAKELSGGQSQRVAIARALMQKPQLIIADEPVASLDPVSGQHVMEVFARLVDEEDTTLIFVSHHLSHAVEFADRIVGIKNKQIDYDVMAADTSIEELESIYGE